MLSHIALVGQVTVDLDFSGVLEAQERLSGTNGKAFITLQWPYMCSHRLRKDDR